MKQKVCLQHDTELFKGIENIPVSGKVFVLLVLFFTVTGDRGVDLLRFLKCADFLRFLKLKCSVCVQYFIILLITVMCFTLALYTSAVLM